MNRANRVHFEELVQKLHECRDCLLAVRFEAYISLPSNCKLQRDIETCLHGINETLRCCLAEELESIAWPRLIQEV